MTFVPIAMKLDLQKELTEQLEIKEIFEFNIGKAHITIDETTVVSWIIMAFFTVLAVILTRNLKVDGEISKRQALLEICYEKMESFFKDVMGKRVEKYIPWLMSLALFIGASNMIGIFGLKPPTKSMQFTLVLALTSIILVEFTAFKEKGFFGRIKAFAKPMWIVTPINIIEIIAKPLSLCMRLFGNIIGAFVIMELIKAATRNILVPTIFSLYFDLFDGFLQAYVFVFLTGIYLQEAAEEDEPTDKQKKKMKKANKKANKKAAKAA